MMAIPDIYGVGLVIPLLSVFAKKLGGGPLFYGILVTSPNTRSSNYSKNKIRIEKSMH